MDKKEKKDDELPVYEVEFIPVERRLKDRRSNPPPGQLPMERRQQGRRKSDVKPEQDPAPETPPPGSVPPGKK